MSPLTPKEAIQSDIVYTMDVKKADAQFRPVFGPAVQLPRLYLPDGVRAGYQGAGMEVTLVLSDPDTKAYIAHVESEAMRLLKEMPNCSPSRVESTFQRAATKLKLKIKPSTGLSERVSVGSFERGSAIALMKPGVVWSNEKGSIGVSWDCIALHFFPTTIDAQAPSTPTKNAGVSCPFELPF